MACLAFESLHPNHTFSKPFGGNTKGFGFGHHFLPDQRRKLITSGQELKPVHARTQSAVAFSVDRMQLERLKRTITAVPPVGCEY